MPTEVTRDRTRLFARCVTFVVLGAYALAALLIFLDGVPEAALHGRVHGFGMILIIAGGAIALQVLRRQLSRKPAERRPRWLALVYLALACGFLMSFGAQAGALPALVIAGALALGLAALRAPAVA
jgi:hypothetical protein